MADHPVLGPLYNAADDLIGRNIAAGRGAKAAFIDPDRTLSYDLLEIETNRFASGLVALGVRRDERVMLAMLDTVDFPIAFLGAIKAGVVPIPVSTRLTPKDYSFMLADSRARALVVDDALWPAFRDGIEDQLELAHIIVAGEASFGHATMGEVLLGGTEDFAPAPTRADDMCFWLYTSGTTGQPKGSVHLHNHMIKTAELYAIPTLGINEDDLVFSAAKLFFAYGLGNGLSFPMAVGATTLLHPGPPDPASVNAILADKRPTIFYGVPTLFAMLLASDGLPGEGDHSMRLATSAGEALPGDILKRWQAHTGIDILDGLGSTEMLHIFLTNRPGDIRPGSSGTPADGYELRLVGDDGGIIESPDTLGFLEVSGPTSAVMYWSQRDKSRETFKGKWTRTGDKYTRDADGYYIFAGRDDDMMKVGGIYVSPFEVESVLLRHDAVLEAAVVGWPDGDGLIKPKAVIVTRDGVDGTKQLAEELTAFVKGELASFKYPRWVEFTDTLPKTATGKIKRYLLRPTA